MGEHVTSRDELETKARATIEWNFGQICDRIDALADAGLISADVQTQLKRCVRKHGNEAIRVIANHLDFHNVTRNHRADRVNINRVARQAQGE